ncbi:MAG: hypothetical protein D8M57_09775 [Candidatus Scalindua sp. AMX11]|nr:MAG: hypothetical protein DWQ00_08525 [Candidatus Scalindua sp.]NOG84905.1 hypothetical protein [Planctomycetota bacterium]RZV84970.1 MAG: hypothetical protein EX341_08165 [Candidatus Scalindua sp. SCAELEC01]TDE65036.1 MAG: hypothetical protein D8M57_09775 [Candidatus Scalindua sp. AMX11]GJQ59428.1 MAG: hypothetical protein SCALA701_22290 [Candidatus Scalindua sp.]
MSEKPRPFARMLTACLLFLAAVALYILLPRYWHDIPEIIKHLLLVLCAVMCVHIIEYAFFWWEIFGQIKSILEEALHPTNQLINSNRILIEKSLRTSNQLISTAAICGLTNIYSSRKDTKDHIYNAVKNAEKRLWLLGIAHSEIVQLDDLLSSLDEKITCGLDVKILLLDALQATAVFRTLLESTASEATKIINTDRTDIKPSDPFFHQRVYSDFVHACNRLRTFPNVGSNVRFYTHTPNCWLMVVDNTVHFQPYTFGRSPAQNASNLCIGDNMPVFQFQKQLDVMTYEILKDHFLKMWVTSNIDLFHAETRNADRGRIVKNLFNLHSWWFKQVHGSLYKPKDDFVNATDLRKFPRRPWGWDQPSLSLELEDCKKTITVTTIRDYSCKGLALQIENSSGLSNGQIVSLQGTSPSEPFEVNYIMDHFLKIKRFMITRIADGLEPIVGLQTIAETVSDDQSG